MSEIAVSSISKTRDSVSSHLQPEKRVENTTYNLLLTEREGRTGEYWPEVVAVRTERSEVRIKTVEGQYSPVQLELARYYMALVPCLF